MAIADVSVAAASGRRSAHRRLDRQTIGFVPIRRLEGSQMTVATKPRFPDLDTLRERVDRLCADFPVFRGEVGERPQLPCG